MVVWTFALPHFPEQGEPWSVGFDAYLAAFLVHWALLSSLAAWRLWRAGRGQPSVARARMRLLAVAADGPDPSRSSSRAFAGESHYGCRAATQVLAFLSALGFALGLVAAAGCCASRLARARSRGGSRRRSRA